MGSFSIDFVNLHMLLKVSFLLTVLRTQMKRSFLKVNITDLKDISVVIVIGADDFETGWQSKN